ncbi:carbohydrate-binding protein [Actinospica durhamensis]|uniref:Carbohydrate-binding protein n=1 Tax=Actinospica durhamensis TaxID=1508375 RepID=A0A941ELW9_9ACTN|nr:carbohydrate-binding protein [Actinospica durhamensis]MBR7833541.1 carbohydrate-binding protein [Actinospica durhamensis]
MGITRRKLLISTAAIPMAGAAVAELADAATAYAASPAASAAGDVVGKITVGYQGWFACIGDGAPIDAWWHWSNNEAQAPSPSNNNIKAWPDMTGYAKGYQTGYANLGNGQPATLFSSVDQQVVNTHFSLMQANGCDTAALQRFDPNGSEGPSRNEVTGMVNTAAQAYGRKFYIMYDASSWTNMQTEMPADWTANMAQYTSSSAYAHQNGKPVVGIWGFGFNDTNHPWSASACLSVIQWFQSQGCYVMGGVPTYWRTGVSDSRAGYLSTYSAFNMISPWMVGRIGTAADSDSFYTNVNVGDQAYCNSNGIDYQPCVLPGDLSANQRAHGDFMWEQFYNMVRVGAQGIYISMFDEYGEGNQILNTAATQAGVPTNSGLQSLDQDGTACSADYYLRLTNDGGRMLKGQIALTNVRPTAPVLSAEGPYGGTAAAVPGTVQAENYDTGGQGVAYNVISVNGSGNSYRSDGVDLEATTDTGGGYDLGWTATGQWFKYTVNVATAGSYQLSFRVAALSAVTDAFHLSNASGTNLSGSVNIAATGGWQTWTTVTATVTLPAGTQTLTLNQDNGGWNINYVTFVSSEGPYGGTAAAVPGTVQAENYDTGGQGVAYNVTSVNGSGNSYRSDGVDLETTTDTGGGYDLGWTATGQWFKYTVNVATAGTHTVGFRVAAPSAVTDAFHLSNASGTNLSGSVNIAATGGWQTWTTVTATVTLPAGTQTLTLDQDNGGWNINYLTIS